VIVRNYLGWGCHTCREARTPANRPRGASRRSKDRWLEARTRGLRDSTADGDEVAADSSPAPLFPRLHVCRGARAPGRRARPRRQPWIIGGGARGGPSSPAGCPPEPRQHEVARQARGGRSSLTGGRSRGSTHRIRMTALGRGHFFLTRFL
jgi:hypothetical protein